jgi:hypothetical protein
MQVSKSMTRPHTLALAAMLLASPSIVVFAADSPGSGASPHTGFSGGMTPGAGTQSGTADGTTDTGATSPGSGKAQGTPLPATNGTATHTQTIGSGSQSGAGSTAHEPEHVKGCMTGVF